LVKPLDEAALSALPMAGGRLEVCFEDAIEVKAQYTNFIKKMGLFVATPNQAPPFSEFALIMHLPDGQVLPPVPARLVQVVPYGDHPGLMLQLLSLPESVSKTLDDVSAEKQSAPPQETAVDESARSSHGERMTLHDKLRKLRPDEKVRLAARANKMERTILIRDSEAQVLTFLLKNPNLTRQEAMEISRQRSINHNTVTVLLANKQWAQIEELRYNLAINPKTPITIAIKLLPSLHMKHVREMAKNQGLKTQLKQAALRIVLQHADGG